MAKTMISRLQESKAATNIYLSKEAALHLAISLIKKSQEKTGVRIIILNKKGRPDFQVHPYNVK